MVYLHMLLEVEMPVAARPMKLWVVQHMLAKVEHPAVQRVKLLAVEPLLPSGEKLP